MTCIVIPEHGGSSGGAAAGSCWAALVTVNVDSTLAVDTYHLLDPPGSPLTLTFPDPVLTPRCKIGIQYISTTAARRCTYVPNAPGDFAFQVDQMELFIPGELIEFVSDGAQWRVATDGRIPHLCVITRSTAQTINSGVTDNIVPDTVVVDNGLISAGGTQITPQRRGFYRIFSTVVVDGLTDGHHVAIEFGRSGSAVARYNPRVWSSSAVAEDRCSISGETINEWDPSTGDNVLWTLRHDQGVAISTFGTGSQSPKLGLIELLSGGRI